ncbi:murein biosynthesis integral membrane protein MurJ [Thermaerobacillus caldiproteolyticus]|uniref:Probable lipid II flippase MurJ n=1 Tax=Thermaerobacillus caldiproteolyticus TaxID=247480 RepID=A0A7V9Z5Z4_9BACL|nr:murein biosynthesis integral membrane protein MurJ [Anoxybacillus caldiproteolyticus]MBA2874606.1 putative peptidoglycan lipid II flippase [Anoxybacillus caldiproteolyticus]
MNKKRLFQVIGVVTIINILSRLLGFIREAVVGYQFGTSSLADSVILAYTIPNFLYLVLGGAVTTAYISVYSKINDEIHKQRFHNTVFTYLLIFTSLLTMLLMIFSKQVVGLFFYGLKGSQLATTSQLFSLMAPSIILLIFSTWFSGILNVQNQFYSAALATLANNGFFVLIAIILYPLCGVYAYGWGAIISSIIMIVVLIVYLRKAGHVRFRFQLGVLEKEYALRMLKIALPVLLGGATLQFYFFVQRIFASQLENGYVAALNYASKFVQLPQTILMTGVTTVIYPLLAKKTAEKDYDGISQIFFKGLQSLIVLIVPVSIFVYFYAEEIVKVIFEYGSFTSQSTKMTAMMLKIFVIGMFAHAANLFVTRFFYAMEKSLTPVVTGIVAVFGVNICIIKLFIQKYGAAAIAWGTTISALFQFVALVGIGLCCLHLRMEKKGVWLRLIGYIASVTAVVSLIRVYFHFGYDIVNLAVGFLLFLISSFSLLILFRLFHYKRLPFSQ